MVGELWAQDVRYSNEVPTDLYAAQADCGASGDLADEGLKRYAAEGITTAHDDASFPGTLKLLRSMADGGKLPIDVVAYPLFKAVSGDVTGGDGSLVAYSGREGFPLLVHCNGDAAIDMVVLDRDL